MLPRGDGTFGEAGAGDDGRWGTAARAGLLGLAGGGFAAPGLGGAALRGFSTFGGRGFSSRGGCGMRPSRPASDPGGRSVSLLSASVRFPTTAPRSRTYHQPSTFHHALPIVQKMPIVTREAMRPCVHHSRCVT